MAICDMGFSAFHLLGVLPPYARQMVKGSEMYQLFCDGSITGKHWSKKKDRGSPAYGWSGWVIKDPEGVIVTHGSLALGTDETMSANVAEYCAVRHGLRWLLDNNKLVPVTVNSDSQLVIYQLTGEYQARNERLRDFRDHIWRVAEFFPVVAYRWIRREENEYADCLSRCLQERYGGVVPPVGTPLEVILQAQKEASHAFDNRLIV